MLPTVINYFNCSWCHVSPPKEIMGKWRGQQWFLTCSLNAKASTGLTKYQVLQMSHLLVFSVGDTAFWPSNLVFYLFDRICFFTGVLTNSAGSHGFPPLLTNTQITGIFNFALELGGHHVAVPVDMFPQGVWKKTHQIKSWQSPKQYYSIFCRSSYVTVSTTKVNTK